MFSGEDVTGTQPRGKYVTVSVDLMSIQTDSPQLGGSNLGREMGMEWWVLKEVTGLKETGDEGKGDSSSRSGFREKGDLTVITFNERVFPQSVSFLAGYGFVIFFLKFDKG